MAKGKTKLQASGFLTSPTYIQVIYPHLLWLRNQRQTASDKRDRDGINASIILFSAIFLEGLIEDVLCTFVLSGHPNPANDGHLKTGQR